MLADLLITLSLLSRGGCAGSSLISWRFVEIVAGLRRPPDPFILKRPIAIPADQLEDDVGLQVYPFIEPFGSPVAIGLHFVQARGATGGGRITDQCSSSLTGQ